MSEQNQAPEPIRVAPLDSWEHCRLPRSVVDDLGIEVGHQIRLRRDEQCALYTVVGTDERVTVSRDGRALLGGDGPVWVDSTVHTPPEDPVVGTFVEEVSEGDDSLVACAPHGGEMEEWTDEQAERVAEDLDGTAWVCRGRWPDWEAFHRWHITSNDLHPGSFPGLAGIADRGFERAVSFHAWRKEGVGVGGAAPRALRVAVRDAIADAVDGSFPVELAAEPRYRGDSEENLVNWLTADGAGGIQIEQGRAVREDHRDDIADAVADVLGRSTP